MPHREAGQDNETIIAASVKVEGDFVSQGNVLIEGVVEGSLKTERDLRVGEKARINADVAASNAVVAGEVRGNVLIAEKLELEATARVFGDVQTKVLTVASGATINGHIVMGQPGEVAERAPRAAVKSENAAEKAKSRVAEKERADEEKEKRTINAFFTS